MRKHFVAATVLALGLLAVAGSAGAADVSGLDAMEFVAGMSAGWNLGNAFDASDCTWLSNELSYESAWCGARTSEALLDAVYDAGFNLIRIPVSWHNHMDADFTISSAWLERVTEVVDYCYQKGMYVIINAHHDVAEDYFYPDEAHLENTLAFTRAVWSQLAENFAPYGERLIFECINEPRLVGHANEWWFPAENADVLASYDALMEANQVFVDTVRAAGGNNADRFLMVCGYCDMPEATVSSNFSLPEDSTPERLIVTAHAYSPYDFAGNVAGGAAFGDAERASNEAIFRELSETFLENGFPVILGEYGAIDKCSDADRVAYYRCMAELGAEYGIKLAVWDNNYFNETDAPVESTFGLFDRATGAIREPEIIEAIMSVF